MLPRYHLFIACGLLLATAGCRGDESDAPSVAEGTTLTPTDEEMDIIAAARAYIGPESDVDSVDLSIVAIQGDFARLLATPPPDETDPATIYLQKTETGWEGIALGTFFTDADLDSLGVPGALRDVDADSL